MGEVLSDLAGMPLEDDSGTLGLFVASNQAMLHGAAAIAYPGFMDKASEEVCGDFFVLPSSIHEVLLLKDTRNGGLQEPGANGSGN